MLIRDAIKARGNKPMTANGSVGGRLLGGDRGEVSHACLYTQIRIIETENM
jgi:hypothetical protein